MRIAGVASPRIAIDADRCDDEVVKEINESGADVLLIGLGNPKQEIWFRRVKSQLRVPVSVGIGGSYEFVVGAVRRAPRWMQSMGLEWLYRVKEEPKRLWKRYVVGFFQFAYMAVPVIVYHAVCAVGARICREKEKEEETGEEKRGEIVLPKIVDGDGVWDCIDSNDVRAFDFSRVQHVTACGWGAFSAILDAFPEARLHGVSPKIRRLMRLHRIFKK